MELSLTPTTADELRQRPSADLWTASIDTDDGRPMWDGSGPTIEHALSNLALSMAEELGG